MVQRKHRLELEAAKSKLFEKKRQLKVGLDGLIDMEVQVNSLKGMMESEKLFFKKCETLLKVMVTHY